MAKQIVGILSQPNGDPLTGTVRIIAADDSADSLIEQSISDIILGAGGEYDFTLQHGEYILQLQTDTRFFRIGTALISDDNPATINEILL